MNVPLVVFPGNTERNCSLWFRHGDKGSLVEVAVIGVLKEWTQRCRHFVYRLEKDGLVGVLSKIVEKVKVLIVHAV